MASGPDRGAARARALDGLSPFGVDAATFDAHERRLAARRGRPVSAEEVFWSLAIERAILLAAAGRWHDACELHLHMARRRHEEGGDPRPLRREAERLRVRHIVASAGGQTVQLEISACECEACAPSHGRPVTAAEGLSGDLGIPHDGCGWCTCAVRARGGPSEPDDLASLLRRWLPGRRPW